MNWSKALDFAKEHSALVASAIFSVTVVIDAVVEAYVDIRNRADECKTREAEANAQASLNMRATAEELHEFAYYTWKYYRDVKLNQEVNKFEDNR